MTYSDPNSDLVWEKMWVGRPADTHFSASGSSPLARADDTNKLETHATLGDRVEDDEDSSDLLKLVAGIALGVAVTIGALKAADARRRRKAHRARRVTRSDAAESTSVADTSGLTALAVAACASQLGEALEEQRTNMTSTEAYRHILEMMLAAAVIAENMSALSNAQLNDDAFVDLRSALEQLTAPQMTDSLNRILEAQSNLLGEQASVDLMSRFGGGRTVEGQYVPLLNARIEKALRLPRTA